MKDFNNIEDWYRNELNNYHVEPEKDVWSSLSEKLDINTPLTDENISEWYKKEVSKLEERPDYTVWEKLSTKLDTSSVWDKLVLSLNRYDQYILWRNLVIRGSSILLLFLGSYLAIDNYFNNKDIKVDQSNSIKSISASNNKSSNKVVNKQNKNNSTYSAAFGNPNLANKQNKNIIENNNPLKLNYPVNSSGVGIHNSLTVSNESNIGNQTLEEKVKSTIKEARKTISPELSRNLGRAKENTSYASLEKIQLFYSSIYIDKLDESKTSVERTIYTDINRHQLTERDISHLYASDDFLVKKDNNKIIFNSKRFSSYFMFGLYARRIYVGFNTGFKKQGMITSFKNNSPMAEYKHNDFLDFGNNVGGTIGFIVSDNFNIEANINVNSTAGYKRAFNAEGLSFQENLNLNYTSISLLAKKMNNKSTFDNKVYSTNLLGGIYGSYLRSAISDINGVSTSLDEYNKTDFGLVLGIEQDRYITKTLVITPGLRYYQGLTNNINENSNYEASRNFAFELNLGVKYIFLKKGKN